MPGCHLDTQERFCGAHTIVLLQTNVYVNNLLWSVEGDIDCHCNMGALIASYGARNVWINNIRVICAVGDEAETDIGPCGGCFEIHPGPGPTNPMEHSWDTWVYR